MDGLEADMQQFRDELNDVWGQMESDSKAYDYLDERLTQLENKTTPSLKELGPQDNSRPPWLDQPGPVRHRPARERNGPWYEDRRSERSERSETRGRAWYDPPADRHRRSSRDSLRSVRYGSYNRAERRYDPLEGLPESPGWWKSGPYGPLPGIFGVHGDIRWFEIAPFPQDGYFIPGKAYRTAAQLKKNTIQPTGIMPTGIPVEMAFKEAKPPLKFKYFTDIPRIATAASDEGMSGKHKNSWLDPRTKKALQKTAKVPVWDGEPATLERCIHRTLRWRRNYANRFDQGQQAKILIAVIENEGVQDREGI